MSKDRFANTRMRQRIRERGSETAGGDLPRELWQPPRRELSKAELRQQFEDAWANTANPPPVRQIPAGKRGAGWTP